MLIQGACAMPVSDGSRPPSAMATISVHAANDSPEIVNVFFISDTGFRQRIGTVAPYGRAKFTARMSRNLTGAFHIHRLSEAAASSISGAVEPFFLADRTVTIRIGQESSFDWWQVGN
ncbi:MAG TPA: hypothetical protein VFO52_06100 [Longimicrobiales bacterium]|nr:hypothetical protein [Longimicrobiales bacterium]